jgi:amino acid transporter
VHYSRILTLFSGAVLTAFIGVNGLVRRLALDRSLPAFLLETNSLRGTNHWIALMFFGLCTSLFLILKGEVGSLANVYSLSFLLVMALFAFGCMMLKFKRSDLKRDVRATWTQVFSPQIFALLMHLVLIASTQVAIATFGVILALIGNISSDPDHLVVFLWCEMFYFVGCGAIAHLLLIQVLLYDDFLCFHHVRASSVTSHSRILQQQALSRIYAVVSSPLLCRCCR